MYQTHRKGEFIIYVNKGVFVYTPYYVWVIHNNYDLNKLTSCTVNSYCPSGFHWKQMFVGYVCVWCMLATVHVYVLVPKKCTVGVIIHQYSVYVETTLDYTITCAHK